MTAGSPRSPRGGAPGAVYTLVRDGPHVDMGVVLSRMKISGVVVGSPADTAGFARHIGRRVKRVNGVRVHTLRELGSVASGSAHVEFEFVSEAPGAHHHASHRVTALDMNHFCSLNARHPVYLGGSVGAAASMAGHGPALPTHSDASRVDAVLMAAPQHSPLRPPHAQSARTPGVDAVSDHLTVFASSQQQGVYRAGYRFPTSPVATPQLVPPTPKWGSDRSVGSGKSPAGGSAKPPPVITTSPAPTTQGATLLDDLVPAHPQQQQQQQPPRSRSPTPIHRGLPLVSSLIDVRDPNRPSPRRNTSAGNIVSFKQPSPKSQNIAATTAAARAAALTGAAGGSNTNTAAASSGIRTVQSGGQQQFLTAPGGGGGGGGGGDDADAGCVASDTTDTYSQGSRRAQKPPPKGLPKRDSSEYIGANLARLQDSLGDGLRPVASRPRGSGGGGGVGIAGGANSRGGAGNGRLHVQVPAGVPHHIFDDEEDEEEEEEPETDSDVGGGDGVGGGFIAVGSNKVGGGGGGLLARRSDPRQPRDHSDAEHRAAVSAVTQLAQRQLRTENLLLRALTSLQARLPQHAQDDDTSTFSEMSSSDGAATADRMVRHRHVNSSSFDAGRRVKSGGQTSRCIDVDVLTGRVAARE